MESSEVLIESPQSTQKRRLDSDDISPQSQQKSKEVREMPTIEETLADIAKKLDKLDEIKADIKDIKREQAEFKKSIADIDGRVKSIEVRVDEIESGENHKIKELEKKIEILECKNQALEQLTLNANITVHNLPASVSDDRKNVETFTTNLIQTLKIELKDTDYQAYAYKLKNGKTANISMSFNSANVKKKVMQAYRELKKSKDGPQLVVEKFFNMPLDHELNGKQIRINNQLTRFNNQLLQYARKFVPSHFIFAIDSDDGIIKVKIQGEKLRAVTSSDEIDKIVSTLAKRVEDNNEKPKAPRTRNNSTSIPATDRVTRKQSSSHSS